MKVLTYEEVSNSDDLLNKAISHYDKHLKYFREYRKQYYHNTKDDNIEKIKCNNRIYAKNFRLKHKDDESYKEKNRIRCKLYYQKNKNNDNTHDISNLY